MTKIPRRSVILDEKTIFQISIVTDACYFIIRMINSMSIRVSFRETQLMEMLHTITISMIFISLYANQLDNKNLKRRCDSLSGITCECANPLVQWKNNEGKIFKINEIYYGKEIILCYIMEFINHTNHYDLVSDAQDCKHLEEYYDVKKGPILKANKCDAMLSQYIRICYYAIQIGLTNVLTFYGNMITKRYVMYLLLNISNERNQCIII
uniref:Uncharacterized protein n=1 Tax=Wuchereria bancrofti TaxID=6293 RepID=A0A1I8ED36_WUCBA